MSCPLHVSEKSSKRAQIYYYEPQSAGINLQSPQGTIHILRNHIFKIFGPPLRNHVFSTENNQKLAFSDSPPPLQVIT